MNFSEDAVGTCVAQQGKVVEQILAHRFALIGAGALGSIALEGLLQKGLCPICFGDNNAKLWGKRKKGIPIFPVCEAILQTQGHAFVTVWGAQSGRQLVTVLNQCKELCNFPCNIVPFSHLFRFFPDVFLPYYCIGDPLKFAKNLNKCKDVFDVLADNISKQAYRKYINWLAFQEWNNDMLEYDLSMYFPNFIRLSNNERFLDCGAFDGDTLKEFITKTEGAFEHYQAVEPDPQNFIRLKTFVTELNDGLQSRIQMIHGTVGKNKGEDIIASFGNPNSKVIDAAENSMLDSNPHRVLRYTIDELSYGKQPTFIKLDIEGAEISALLGGERTINASETKWAVSIYHKQSDAWEIPSFFLQNNNYQLYVRLAGPEMWDTVFFAIPRQGD